MIPIIQKLRVLSAFQALERMQNHGLDSAYGVDGDKARQIIRTTAGVEIEPTDFVSGPTVEDYLYSIGYQLDTTGGAA